MIPTTTDPSQHPYAVCVTKLKAQEVLLKVGVLVHLQDPPKTIHPDQARALLFKLPQYHCMGMRVWSMGDQGFIVWMLPIQHYTSAQAQTFFSAFITSVQSIQFLPPAKPSNN